MLSSRLNSVLTDCTLMKWMAKTNVIPAAHLVQWLAVSPRYQPQELIGNLVLLFKMLIKEFQLITEEKQLEG